jgi:hypothetical protein
MSDHNLQHVKVLQKEGKRILPTVVRVLHKNSDFESHPSCLMTDNYHCRVTGMEMETTTRLRMMGIGKGNVG